MWFILRSIGSGNINNNNNNHRYFVVNCPNAMHHPDSNNKPIYLRLTTYFA